MDKPGVIIDNLRAEISARIAEFTTTNEIFKIDNPRISELQPGDLLIFEGDDTVTIYQLDPAQSLCSPVLSNNNFELEIIVIKRLLLEPGSFRFRFVTFPLYKITLSVVANNERTITLIQDPVSSNLCIDSEHPFYVLRQS